MSGDCFGMLRSIMGGRCAQACLPTTIKSQLQLKRAQFSAANAFPGVVTQTLEKAWAQDLYKSELRGVLGTYIHWWSVCKDRRPGQKLLTRWSRYTQIPRIGIMCLLC
jgi:hypothetical protein